VREEFFPPPPPPRPKREPAPIPERWCPSLDELGRAEPVRLVLGRSDAAVVVVMGLVVYTTGWVFRAAVLLREPWDSASHVLARPGVPEPARRLRFGIEFPDGARATSIDGLPSYQTRPGGPVLMPSGGAGSRPRDRRRLVFDWWVWPLPGPGHITLYCEWPDAGVRLTGTQLSTTPIVGGYGQP
jgi:hypothetical protein